MNRVKSGQKNLHLNITEDLIRDSIKEDSSKCMIAQALRLRGASSVHVTAETASFNLDNIRYTAPLPARAALELVRFDEDRESVKPFKINIVLAQAYSRPVLKQPKRKKRGPTAVIKRRSSPVAKRSKRRFHGLRVIEAQAR